MKNAPMYTLDKIKFATDQPTFERAVGLYEKNRVRNVIEHSGHFTATVYGTKPYKVKVSKRAYDEADCTCYLGQHDTLCKHMVVLAIHAVKQGKPLTMQDVEASYAPSCSGKVGTLSNDELKMIKLQITKSVRYIKPYEGPSRTWFTYQNLLDEGVARLSSIVSKLPVSKQTSDLLVSLLLRLDRKLSHGGVDDSNGTVGGFIEESVLVLKEFVTLDPECKKSFKKLIDRETCFGWEEPLLTLI